MSQMGQSETSALDLGVAASTRHPETGHPGPPEKKRGLTLQLGLQK
jgi:hypothetical protein